MIRLLREKYDMTRKKQDLIDLEELLVRKLDFSLRNVSPITFLERFFRIFGIDRVEKDSNAESIAKLSVEFCTLTQRNCEFLDVKPSLKAAASLLLAFNISQSQVATSIGIKRVPELQV